MPEPLLSATDLGPETPFSVTRPVTLPAPERGSDLELRVSAPNEGSGLPLVVFSHGFAEYMDSYTPLTEFWASHGFVVLQPAHLDSSRYGMAPSDPRFADLWRSRIQDLARTLDGLDAIQASVPQLDGRIDRDRIAIAGHSWGATTASALIGARIIDADGNVGESMRDERIQAGVLFAVAGTGGENLTPFAAEHFSFMNPDFEQMAPPALIVAGDEDQSPLSSRGPDWWTDAYHYSPGQKALLTLAGAQHMMGGIAGHSTHETTDWSPDRVALLQHASAAYLLDALGLDGARWIKASNGLGSREDAQLHTK
jgi:predicted dienelactone hydrolase